MTRSLSIAERVEQVRQSIGLNKSKFSHTLGMNPQAYAEFADSRSSQPNMELVLGIVSQFNVNPMWLLCGTGPVYLEEHAPTSLVSSNAQAPMVRDREREALPEGINEADWLRANVLREIGSLQLELRSIAERCDRMSERLARAIALLDDRGPHSARE